MLFRSPGNTTPLMGTSMTGAAIYSNPLVASVPGFAAPSGYSPYAPYSMAGYPMVPFNPMLGFSPTPTPTAPPSAERSAAPSQQIYPPGFFFNQTGPYFSNHAAPSVVTIASAITIKLTSENYLIWRAQVGPLLRSHLLMGYVDGSFRCPQPIVLVSHGSGTQEQPNPAYQHWIQQDQAILSAFVSSMTEGVVGMVMFATTSYEAWETLSGAFASTSIARSSGIRQQMSEQIGRAHV